ncbi:hypothetical protein IKX12_02100 [Candidatus Saccharibacteria bacterium]|nr:hypothetical protein [Candidatus Saccharibacteria bacterium]
MRKAEEFDTVEKLGFKAETGTYLLECFGSVDRIIFEGRRAAYLKSSKYDYLDANKQQKKLSRQITKELIDVLDANDLIRHDLVIIFRIGLLYTFLGHSGYVASFTDIKTGCKYRDACREFSLKDSNSLYESLETPTPEQVTKLKMAIAARLDPEECIVIMLRLSGHVGEAESTTVLANTFGIEERQAMAIKQSAMLKLHRAAASENRLPPFPIDDDKIIPESFS